MRNNRRNKILSIQKQSVSGVLSSNYSGKDKIKYATQSVSNTFKNKPSVRMTDDYDVKHDNVGLTKECLTSCVLCIAKYEERYINEWITYHLSIGFDHIFVLDNNPFGKELSLKYDNVTVIPYNGVEFTVFNVDQCKAYNYAMKYICELDFDLVAVIDVDEFITFEGKSFDSIKKGFSKGEYNHVGLKWRIYTDNGYVYSNECDDTDNVLKTYTEPIPAILEKNNEVECCLTKPMFTIKDFNRFSIDPHYVIVENEKYRCFERNDAYIKHYRTKNLETYIREKIMLRNGVIAPFTCRGERIVEGYFKFNNINKRKTDAFIDICVKNDYLLSPYDINILSSEKHFDGKKILVYTYLIGGYANRALFEGLLTNLRKYLLFDFDFFLVTDKRSEFGSYDGVTIVEIVTEKFDTIKEYKDYALAIKFKLLYENFHKWDKYSDIMFVNSNLRFAKKTELSFFYNGFNDNNRIVGTTHFMSRDCYDYLQASFWVSQSHFLRDILCPYIQRQLDKDNKDGIVAEWHDETYYNRFYVNNKELWHVIDGYSNFILIDKTELIGKEWDVHYNDLLYGQDREKHTIVDFKVSKGKIIGFDNVKKLINDGFNRFKVYDVLEKSVVDADGVRTRSDDMFYYHLKSVFVNKSVLFEICDLLKKSDDNKNKIYLVYAHKE